MVGALMPRLVSRVTILTLLVLACAGMVVQAGSLPHVHKAHDPGIYNEEHDLTLLAALAAHGLLSDAAPVPGIDAVVSTLLALVPERPALRSVHTGPSRAPPAA
jgi:hypothetical protein